MLAPSEFEGTPTRGYLDSATYGRLVREGLAQEVLANRPKMRKAVLPPDQCSFRSHGMSVFVLRPGQDPHHLPGVGVQFYAQSESERRKWERFVTHVRQNPPTLPPEAIDPSMRSSPYGRTFPSHP